LRMDKTRLVYYWDMGFERVDHVVCGMWYVVCGMWYVVCGMW
jgi:hypothetical protein